ncbi:MAG: hypothetical protein U9R40_05890, partial [Synergistota bacterium]|nr:hypothetical protein [Synergistota bacterium]
GVDETLWRENPDCQRKPHKTRSRQTTFIPGYPNPIHPIFLLAVKMFFQIPVVVSPMPIGTW